ncbi:hypothetical protein GQ42DRAFT_6845 [Ramicandelaber brevisporus]|nr:hypothetical protein GQ42DRAFT_6845 [Ramicandelaber brevisporus]
MAADGKLIAQLQQELDAAHLQNSKLASQNATLQEQNSEMLRESETLTKRLRLAQAEAAEARNAQERFERQFFDAERTMADLRRDLASQQRARLDLSRKAQLEASNFEKERSGWARRESELNAQIQRQQTLARRATISGPQSPTIAADVLGGGSESPASSRASIYGHGHGHSRAPSRASTFTPVIIGNTLGGIGGDGQDQTGTDASINSGDEGNSSGVSELERRVLISARTIHTQEQLIKDLRVELGGTQSSLRTSTTRCDEQSRRIELLENEVRDLRQVNETLMEDNESYQILLHESTVSGGFRLKNELRNSTESDDLIGDDAENNINNGDNNDDNNIGSPRALSSDGVNPIELDEQQQMGGGLNLAAELNRADTQQNTDSKNNSNSNATSTFDPLAEIQLRNDIRTLQAECRGLKDENKALSLYINKILSRILLSKGGLEEVLSHDFDSRPGKRASKMTLNSTNNKATNPAPPALQPPSSTTTSRFSLLFRSPLTAAEKPANNSPHIPQQPQQQVTTDQQPPSPGSSKRLGVRRHHSMSVHQSPSTTFDHPMPTASSNAQADNSLNRRQGGVFGFQFTSLDSTTGDQATPSSSSSSAHGITSQPQSPTLASAATAVDADGRGSRASGIFGGAFRRMSLFGGNNSTTPSN